VVQFDASINRSALPSASIAPLNAPGQFPCRVARLCAVDFSNWFDRRGPAAASAYDPRVWCDPRARRDRANRAVLARKSIDRVARNVQDISQHGHLPSVDVAPITRPLGAL